MRRAPLALSVKNCRIMSEAPGHHAPVAVALVSLQHRRARPVLLLNRG